MTVAETRTKVRVLVTGATGFIGKAVVEELVRQGMDVYGAARKGNKRAPEGVAGFFGIDLTEDAVWDDALVDVDVIIHTAGLAHVVKKANASEAEEFQRVNTLATLNLAQQALRNGVRRLVFLSSIGVNGEETGDMAFTEKSIPAPRTPYAVSKWEAEQGLRALVPGLDVVIIRPPLVYGPDAPGNFGTLIRAVKKGWPLPLAGIENRRSFVARENLVDLVIACATHPRAANETFVVSDGDDISTSELLRRTALAFGRPSRLYRVPTWVLRIGAALLYRSDMMRKLSGSLRVDDSYTREVLGWTPPVTMLQALSRLGAKDGNK